MLCKKCGEENSNNSKFCMNCGTALREYEIENIEQDGHRESFTMEEDEPIYNYLIINILITIMSMMMCCNVFALVGIISIVYSFKVKASINQKEMEKAKYYSSKAQKWLWITIISSFVWILVLFGIMFIVNN